MRVLARVLAAVPQCQALAALESPDLGSLVVEPVLLVGLAPGLVLVAPGPVPVAPV